MCVLNGGGEVRVGDMYRLSEWAESEPLNLRLPPPAASVGYRAMELSVGKYHCLGSPALSDHLHRILEHSRRGLSNGAIDIAVQCIDVQTRDITI